MSFFAELKRRNVVRVGIAYAVTSWLVLQLADIIVDNLPVPDWTMQVIMLALVCGLPVVLVFSWAFELTPEGIKKESEVDRSSSITHKTGRKLDRAIIVILVLALGYFVFDKFSPVGPSEQAGEVAKTENAQEMAEAARDDQVIETADIPENSIAVLPFVNMSSDADQEYFSDGISEELLNVLAKFPGVHVAARTSSFQFKGQNRDISEIAKLLKVRHVLEGSVRKAGNKVRITAQLIEADNGYHLWSETYDREIDDIFAVQDEISAAIGEAMRVELALGGEDEIQAPRVAEASNTAAYEAFLKGRHLVNQRGRRNIFAARDHLERSVRLDPEYAPAHAWLAITHALLLAGPSTYGDYSRAEMLRKAIPHAERAMELDPGLAESWGSRGLIALSSPELEPAMADLKKALELNSVYVDAMTWYMLAAQALGDWDTAHETAKRIYEVDPLSVVGRMNYAGMVSAIDVQRARDIAMSIEPQNRWAAYTSRGWAEFAGGDLGLVVHWLLRAYGEDPSDEFSNGGLMYALQLVGQTEEAERISDRNHHYLELANGNTEAAVSIARANLADDSENLVLQLEMADMLYSARRMDEAAEIYRALMAEVPDGQILLNPIDLTTISMMRYASLVAAAGRQEEAQDLVNRHRKTYLMKDDVGMASGTDHFSESLALMVEQNHDQALAKLEQAIDAHFNDPVLMDDPAFDAVRQNPEFMALNARLDGILDEQRVKVLDVMCNHNPVPETWQPLRKTCLGIAAGP